ncbi:MAG: hypothetical protein LBF59_00460 [Prevotellaceae bacterium]|nr:hypothetical protein [Prevotellaceae bacterium]
MENGDVWRRRGDVWRRRGDVWRRVETPWRRKILRLYKSTPSTTPLTTTALSDVETQYIASQFSSRR